MLTESQKSAARYHGGKEQTNRRRHLRQLRTSLFNVRNDAALQSSDHASIAQTLHVLDRLLAEVQADLAAANTIKRDYDKHVALTRALLDAIPLTGIADVIALCELDRQLGRPDLLLNDIECNGWDYTSSTLKRQALDGLAHRGAYGQRDPTEFAASVRAAMPAAAEKHAALIRQITTLAVSQQLQKTA